jgi:hypothetical protein
MQKMKVNAYMALEIVKGEGTQVNTTIQLERSGK